MIKDINYFSDGCAAQHKNCKNFINICCHSQDFNLTATWTFFAISHENYLLWWHLRNYKTASCKRISKIHDLKFWLVTKDTLSETREYLKKKFLLDNTILGTLTLFLELSLFTILFHCHLIPLVLKELVHMNIFV